MAIFTLPEIDEQLTAWKAALIACSRNQSHEYNGRKLTSADLPEIRSTLLFWLVSRIYGCVQVLAIHQVYDIGLFQGI
jgi:hypothetical protein